MAQRGSEAEWGGVERRREARRRAIARGAWERLADLGYADASLDALARDVGLSKQALLFYFRDKGDLWAEALSLAVEEVSQVLTRSTLGERGPTAIRALRRGLDDLARVLPAPLALVLDAPGAAVRGSAEQQQRVQKAHGTLLQQLAESLAFPRPIGDPDLRLARHAWFALLACHREARLHERSGLAPRPQLAADLDFCEEQLVAADRSRA